jgi:hypothetical protein
MHQAQIGPSGAIRFDPKLFIIFHAAGEQQQRNKGECQAFHVNFLTFSFTLLPLNHEPFFWQEKNEQNSRFHA